MNKFELPNELLNTLRCSTCSEYLSVFPIFLTVNQDTQICGRCNVQNDNGYIRDEAYEMIAQFFKFPCQFARNGCEENLQPGKLKIHEFLCLFRMQKCLTYRSTNCKWAGPNSSIKDHCLSTHANLVIQNNTFPVNLNINIGNNLLLIHRRELFLVSWEVDSKSNVFSCSVSQIMLSSDRQTFDYSLKLEQLDGSLVHRCNERSMHTTETTIQSLDVIKQKFKPAEIILVRVQVSSRDEPNVTPVTEAKPNHPDINWSLITELECPICLEYMVPPIYQCVQGHSICAVCKPLLNQCGLCKKAINSTRNYALESMVTKLTFPCKYHNEGCNAGLEITAITNHQVSCEYGPFMCPLHQEDNCNHKVINKNMGKHIEEKHQRYLLKTDKMDIKTNENIKKSVIVKFHDVYILHTIKFDRAAEMFYWSFQVINSVKDGTTYKFEIDIIDQSGNNLCQRTIGRCVSYLNEAETFSKKGTYTQYMYDQLASFIVHDSLSYKIRLMQN